MADRSTCLGAAALAFATLGLLAAGCGDDKAVQPNGSHKADAGNKDSSDAGCACAPLPKDIGPKDMGGDPTKVALTGGQLEGDVMGGAVRFLKIPYAKPPMGALRWKAPEDSDGWDGVRHESDFASPCPQPPSQQSSASTNEDCLYLNVWRPNNTIAGAPVMVWIHGGGFTTGSAADFVPLTDKFLWYNGQVFAEHGVVLVTINYRLGVMGFFAHPELKDEASPLGNQGLLDQRQALRWVRDNIAAFGGDPKNVTIFGQSAGSGSVCMHVASPGSRGLFQRAISESGGCTGTGGPNAATDFDAINAQVKQFASDHGCDGDKTLECLRALPVDQLVSQTFVDRTMGMDTLRRSFNWGAVVDGEGGFLPEPAGALFDRGDVAKVPYILGSTNDEARLYFISATVPDNDAEYKDMIDTKYGDFADRVLALYPVSNFDGDYRKASARIATDSGIVCSTLDTARRAAKAGLPVFMYNYNVDWSIARNVFGACHTAEISTVFGTPYMETDENQALSVAMNTYWATFARTGDPNFKLEPAKWPAFKPDANNDDERIQFDSGYEQLKSFRKEECQLWADFAAAQ